MCRQALLYAVPAPPKACVAPGTEVPSCIVATGTVPGLPWLMGANIGFDMAIADVWLPWLHGQPVVVLETERRTPSALAEAYRLGARVVSLSPTVAAAA